MHNKWKTGICSWNDMQHFKITISSTQERTQSTCWIILLCMSCNENQPARSLDQTELVQLPKLSRHRIWLLAGLVVHQKSKVSLEGCKTPQPDQQTDLWKTLVRLVVCERPLGALVIARFSDATKMSIYLTLTFAVSGTLLSFSDYFR
jgi:hypothetical protein